MNISKKKLALIVLLPILLVGTAFAAYSVYKNTFTVTTVECIEVIQEAYGEGMELTPPADMGPWDAWCGRWFVHNTGNALLITMKITSTYSGYIKSGITIVESNEVHTWGGYYISEPGWDGGLELPYEFSFVIGTNEYTEGETYNRGAHWSDYFASPTDIKDPSAWVMVEAGFHTLGDTPPGITIDWSIEFLRS